MTLEQAIDLLERYDAGQAPCSNEALRLVLAAAKEPTAGNLAEHARSCPELTENSEDFCTCGLKWRRALVTEQEMHAAWRKRAEEAEAALAKEPLVYARVKELEEEAASETRWADQYKAERDALQTKLDAVREWAEVDARERSTDEQYEPQTNGEVAAWECAYDKACVDSAEAILAILNTEPARATADEDARGEKEA